MKTLKEIYYSDVSLYSSKWSHYFDIYEQWFNKFVDKKPVVIEIGIDNGGSLQMWKKYFGQDSTVIGIDIRPKVTQIEGCQIIRGDQGDARFWDNFLSACPYIDVVIDDGSHFSDHQLLTFSKLFPHMNENGIYLVEDTHSSYMDTFNGAYLAPYTFIEYMKRTIDGLHEDYIKDKPAFPEIWRSIKSLHFYDSVTIIEKKFREKNEVTYIHRDSYVR